MKSADFDDLLGTPARLAILATLAERDESGTAEPWSFMDLREETGLADGNLHVQTRKLIEAGYVTRFRAARGTRLVTCFDLTEAGRRALRQLLEQLQGALGERVEGQWVRSGGRATRRGDASQVW